MCSSDLREAGVEVIFGEKLNLKGGVKKDGTRITEIMMESGRIFSGEMFIDATYEGDLMAESGVSYTFGREDNLKYNETLNGIQVKNAKYHQFIKPVDGYIKPGDPSGGLLPGINSSIEKDGTGDKRIQAYCFRLCATNVPENRRPWPKPENYEPIRYELMLRNFEAGDHRIPWILNIMPNGKTDSNNKFAFSTDNIGMNYNYPDAGYETRSLIIKEHENYQKGLDRKSTRLNSSHIPLSRMPSSA